MSRSNEHPNGSAHDSPHTSVNPYVEAVRGEQPRDLTTFELNTDPYANIIPSPGRMAVEASGIERDEKRRRNPLLVAVSLILIVVLVLPVMAQVFIRLFH
jgi:hypothetical protein